MNSYKLLLLITEKKTEAVNVYLVSNNGEGVGGGELEGGGGGAKKKMSLAAQAIKQSRGLDGAEWV